MPVAGSAVEVGKWVSWAWAAWVNAAATVAVAGSGVLVLAAVGWAITGVCVGKGVAVAVGKLSAAAVAVSA
jgi:hypothetical protein